MESYNNTLWLSCFKIFKNLEEINLKNWSRNRHAPGHNRVAKVALFNVFFKIYAQLSDISKNKVVSYGMSLDKLEFQSKFLAI